MIVAFGFFDRFLDILGLLYVVTVIFKMARAYPVRRWFF